MTYTVTRYDYPNGRATAREPLVHATYDAAVKARRILLKVIRKEGSNSTVGIADAQGKPL